jgi:hypothetical protein
VSWLRVLWFKLGLKVLVALSSFEYSNPTWDLSEVRVRVQGLVSWLRVLWFRSGLSVLGFRTWGCWSR